jgi:hypothetical protein
LREVAMLDDSTELSITRPHTRASAPKADNAALKYLEASGAVAISAESFRS